MSATDELRALLDERGVEWSAPTSFDGTARYDTTTSDYWFHEFNGKMTIHGLTPEQAIAATLGTGTCHMRLACEEEDADGCIWPDHYECDVCGANVNGIMPYCDTEVPPHFCPNCGRKVVAE